MFWPEATLIVPAAAQPSYMDQVLDSGPLAYWPMNELGGSVAHCLVDSDQDGTYHNVQLATDETGPFGTPAPYFDGSTSYLDVISDALKSSFNGATGTCLAWMRAHDWTDALTCYVFNLRVDADNYYYLREGPSAGYIATVAEAGGGLCNKSKSGISDPGWVPVLITWSDNANAREFRLFWQGSQVGTVCRNFLTWTGTLDSAIIGASNDIPMSVFLGGLAHVVIWPRVLSQAEITFFTNP